MELESPSSETLSAELESLRQRVRDLEARLDDERHSAGDRFRCAVDAAPNGIVMTDGDGRILFANRRARQLFGYELDGEMESMSIEHLMPERFRIRHVGLRESYHGAPEPRPMGTGRDLYACRKDGSEFPVEIGLTPVEIGGERLILGMIADITERQRATAAMSEKARILASVHEAVFTVDGGGVIRSWNPGATAIFTWSEAEIVGQPVSRLCPPEEPDRFHTIILDGLRHQSRFESILRCHRRDGSAITLAIRAAQTVFPDTGQAGAIVCAHDITRQRELEDEIVQIAEKEQRRIGQDLHDDLCQQLAGIGCLAKVLQQELDASGSTRPADALGNLVEMISQANTRAREISRGLAPAMIQREGLTGALSELASRTRRIFGVPCQFHCPDPIFVEDEKRAVQLYRIAQEATSNAVKHSDATRIDIHLDLLPRRLRLRIADDGRGMPPKGATGPSGLGLMTMAHRARLVDGDLQVDSSPGTGTTITCIAPHQNE
ncbi:MAG: PAS domain S-box protein [Verrucomicrobiales bacterium]|nr:PAS domain S-box protein [Verrucomicrobiales bacterium]